jgi:hypothetical protein
MKQRTDTAPPPELKPYTLQDLARDYPLQPGVDEDGRQIHRPRADSLCQASRWTR